MALRRALVQIEEFPARMRPAGLLSDAGSKQGFVPPAAFCFRALVPLLEFPSFAAAKRIES